jgi:hypothetical protein
MGGVVHSPEVRRLMETINPVNFDIAPRNARFFIIKSYSEDDVHKSIKYGVWASTDTGNRRLDAAYRESAHRGPIYLFFSVNASGQFSGLAQMESALDYTKKFGSWGQDKWNGTFQIKWTFIKDVANNQFRHIVLVNNENKPVTNSRDTQEVPEDQGREMLRIFHTYRSRTSILDDFSFYDKRQELMEARMMHAAQQAQAQAQAQQQAQQQQQQQQHGLNADPLASLGLGSGMGGAPMGGLVGMSGMGGGAPSLAGISGSAGLGVGLGTASGGLGSVGLGGGLVGSGMEGGSATAGLPGMGGSGLPMPSGGGEMVGMGGGSIGGSSGGAMGAMPGFSPGGIGGFTSTGGDLAQNPAFPILGGGSRPQ